VNALTLAKEYPAYLRHWKLAGKLTRGDVYAPIRQLTWRVKKARRRAGRIIYFFDMTNLYRTNITQNVKNNKNKSFVCFLCTLIQLHSTPVDFFDLGDRYLIYLRTASKPTLSVPRLQLLILILFKKYKTSLKTFTRLRLQPTFRKIQPNLLRPHKPTNNLLLLRILSNQRTITRTDHHPWLFHLTLYPINTLKYVIIEWFVIYVCYCYLFGIVEDWLYVFWFIF